ncbi:Anthocyanidin 5,3-O-glucosyltransferase [Platanthera zijinensis]|uniref:Anthocyanidin 5,3-O-glucosyltransferase n=1 Tax=Platanthera zijinensis TaxID=2320716 RepID=A0AAP0B6P6_9ASPA
MGGNEIVLFPLAAMGHLKPMVELGKLFLRQGLSVTILILQFPKFDNKPINSYIDTVSAANPALSFHRLSSPPSTVEAPTFIHHFRLAIPQLQDYLSCNSSATALVLDFFFDDAIDVINKMNPRLPCYFFFPTSASNLAAFLYLPFLHKEQTVSFKDLGDTPVNFPGFPSPIPAFDMPIRISDRSSEAYKAVIVQYDRLPKSSGIIVNSFRALEPKALAAIADGLCTPGRTMAPIYCVGPITSMDGQEHNETAGSERRHYSLEWLDGQPRGSVVFLCFGSMGGAFSEAQILEVAEGLERSGQRFLWVVRGSLPEVDLEAVLPEGFGERTKGRGLVVNWWAPQAAVLGHAAVGGFVTHCGWNSVLESIVAGVAMIAWPMYAEQRMNRVFLVEEAKIAAEMPGYRDGLVRSYEVEEKVRWLMESSGGKEMRARAAAVRERAKAAMREGGSSYEDMVKMVHSLTTAGGGERPTVDHLLSSTWG